MIEDYLLLVYSFKKGISRTNTNKLQFKLNYLRNMAFWKIKLKPCI
jgi:hypothetical protein